MNNNLIILGTDNQERLVAIHEGSEVDLQPGDYITLPKEYDLESFLRLDGDLVIEVPNVGVVTIKCFFTETEVYEDDIFARNLFSSYIFENGIIQGDEIHGASEIARKLSVILQVYNKDGERIHDIHIQPGGEFELTDYLKNKFIYTPNAVLEHEGYNLIISPKDSAEPITLKNFFPDNVEYELLSSGNSAYEHANLLQDDNQTLKQGQNINNDEYRIHANSIVITTAVGGLLLQNPALSKGDIINDALGVDNGRNDNLKNNVDANQASILQNANASNDILLSQPLQQVNEENLNDELDQNNNNSTDPNTITDTFDQKQNAALTSPIISGSQVEGNTDGEAILENLQLNTNNGVEIDKNSGFNKNANTPNANPNSQSTNQNSGTTNTNDIIQSQNTVINNSPTAAVNTIATNEDTQFIFNANDFNFSDIDGDSLSQIQVTSLESAGALKLNGVDVTLNQVISKADIDSGLLTFDPAADANGASYDSFQFKVHDGTEYSASAYSMTVDVNAINDAPTAAINSIATIDIRFRNHLIKRDIHTIKF